MTPAYPAEALAQACQDMTLVARGIIDAEGMVGEVRDSPFLRTPDTACAAFFRKATEQTVLRWQFSPAFKRVLLELATDGPHGQPKWDIQAIPWCADFTFEFRIVGGKGTVVTRR